MLVRSVFGRKREYRIQFNKEKNGCWYVDFPHWPFSHDNLAMVSGADKMLELLSDGDLYVKVSVIPANKREQHEGYIELIQTEHSLLGGSTYQTDWKPFMTRFKRNTMWICPVTLFVLGRYPKFIYVKRVDDKEAKLQRGPDIVWKMDDDEHPIISPSANIISKEGGIKGEDEYDLARFLRAQEYESGGYRDALKEVKAGCKREHWIWYIFPQINGLGHSDYQEYYGIKSLDEARAYLCHELLGYRLREITEALLQLNGYTAIGIFGNIDSMKVRSCMTLFDIVSPHDIFERVLDKYYNGERCKLTLERFALNYD